MKKIFTVIFMYFMFVNPASAVISTEEAISPEYIINHGYSPEAARIINVQNAQINGKKPTYFGTKPYRWRTKYPSVNFCINYLINQYVGTDDEHFGTHVFNPSVRWDDL